MAPSIGAMKTAFHKQTLCSKAAAFARSLELWAFALPMLFVLAAFALSVSPELRGLGPNLAFGVGAAYVPAELNDGKGQALYSGMASKKMMGGL